MAEGLRPNVSGVPTAVVAVIVDGWAFSAMSRPTALELVTRLREIRSVAAWSELREAVRRCPTAPLIPRGPDSDESDDEEG